MRNPDRHESVWDSWPAAEPANKDGREQVRRLAMLIDNLPGMVYRCAAQAPWPFDYASGGVEALTGYTAPDLVGGEKSWGDIIHDDDLVRVMAETDSAVAERRPFSLVYRIIHRSGDVRWVHERGQGVHDASGALVYLEGFIGDVTEQKRTEQALRESEEHYRYTVELSPQMPWTADPAGNILTPHWRWQDRTGLSGDAALGRGWMTALHPDDAAGVAAAMARSLQTGQPYDAKYRVRMVDGSYRWVRAQAYARRNETGEIIRWYGATTDIHEYELAEQALRESEEHYRHRVELSPQVPWTANAQGAIIDVSPRWSDLTGLTREQTAGDGWIQIVHPDDIVAAKSAWSRSLSSGEPFDVEYRVLLRDGTYRWFRVRAAARRGEGGDIVLWYGTAEDIHDGKLAHAALHDTEERYRLAARATNDAIWDWDLKAGRMSWNEAIGTHFGYPEAEAGTTALWWEERIHPDDRERISRQIEFAISEDSERWVGEYRFLKGDGTYADIYDCGYIIRDGSGKATRMVGAMLDLTERRQAAAALHDREERLRLAVQATGLGIWDFDVATGERRWSDELRAIFGVADDAPADASLALSLVRAEYRPRIVGFFRAAHAGRADFEFDETLPIVRADTGEERWVSTNGHKIFDEQGRLSRVLLTVRDITEERTAEERIRWAASHDALTELPNRALFQDRLQHALVYAARARAKVGLLLLDLDHFKQVNDTLGHDAGDALLRSFAERLHDCVRSTDMVARLGGDEFAIILPDLRGERGIREVADSILARLREPFTFRGHILDCRASIGAALFPEHGVEAEELLKHADLALYSAKAAGRGGIQTFRSGMRADMQRRSSMLRMARDALDAGRILPSYQPKVEMSTGRIAGFEALLRWRHPRNGLQLPGTIAAALEDIELAVSLSERMHASVIDDLRRWLDSGLEIGHVAINASAAEFRQGDYAERVLERLRAADIPTSRLEVEVTETVFLGRGAECVERALQTLSAEGVRIALDDFGTGYASLSHLKRFPVDIIKIDQSFVRNLEADPDDAAIIRAVLNLGQSLGITIVAEGIETSAQAAYLWAQGCDLAQGYLFGRPTFARTIPNLLRTWPTNKTWMATRSGSA